MTVRSAEDMLAVLIRSASIGANREDAEMIAERADTNSSELARTAVALAEGMGLDPSAASDIFTGIQAGIILMNEVG